MGLGQFVLGESFSRFKEVFAVLEETVENFAVEVPDVNGEVGHVHQTSFSHDQTHTYSDGPRLDMYKRRQKNVTTGTCSYMSQTGESEKKKEYQPTGYSDPFVDELKQV